MPLTHQFFHLEDRLERALFRTSGVSSDVGTGGDPPNSDLLSLSDAVSPSSLFSDSDSCNFSSGSGSRSPHSRCRSSLIPTPTRSSAPLRAPPLLRALRRQGEGEDREPPANHTRGMAAGGGAKRPWPRPCVPGCEEAAAVMSGAGAQLVVEKGKRP